MEVTSTKKVLGTPQCYAFAEAVRASMPWKLAFRDVLLTDMGAARICESAIMTGRLQHLTVTGTCLGFRFCTTLHAILRTRAGNTLTDLVLQGCGLGGHLDQ